MAIKDKKHEQLGMNPSTASGRLVKDLLFNFIVKTGNDSCFRCGSKLTRGTFSIEHKTNWLDSGKAVELFFDMDNISYSHLSCNRDAATSNKLPCGTAAMYKSGCRCRPCTDAIVTRQQPRYTPERRRKAYEREKLKLVD